MIVILSPSDSMSSFTLSEALEVHLLNFEKKLILDSALHNPNAKPNLSQPALKIRKPECRSMTLAELLPAPLYFSAPLISRWGARCQ